MRERNVLWIYVFVLLGLLLVAVPSATAERNRVGIWIDSRSGDVTGITASLIDAGFTVTRINGRAEFKDPELLTELDVLFFPGGWNALQFLDFECRQLAVDFVAQGKGILADFFRGAYVRGDNRPLFPEIGAGYNRVSANYVFTGDNHAITEGMDLPWGHRNWDHILYETGSMATSFLKDGNGEGVGIAGEPWGGRYVAIGVYFAATGTEPLTGNEKTLFLNSIRWLAGAERLEGDALARNRAAAELEFLRRERTLDYTHHDRGPDRRSGVIPTARNLIRTEVEMWRLRLNRITSWLDDTAGRQAVEAMISELDEHLAILDQNRDMVTEIVLSEIANADLQTLRDNDPAEFAELVPGQLLPRADIDRVTTAAEQVYRRYRDPAEQARQLSASRELERDRKTIPDLITQCASPDAVVRRRAAQELGRIGEPGTASWWQRLRQRTTPVSTLIGLLDDPDGQVRRNAVHALGWMQAQEAVPALLERLDAPDPWMRRRATQALGQIGDRSAVAALIDLVPHPDHATAVNAILALGWIGDPSASPVLREILESHEGEKLVAAIQALGHIGDAQALPAIEKLAQGSRGSGRFDNRLLAAEAATTALAEIADGGRGESGVRQPDYLALHEMFYGVREELNYFIGRPGEAFVMFPQFKAFPEAFFDYIREAGATGLVSGWSDIRFTAEELDRHLEWAGERGIRWIVDLPGQFGGLAEKPGCAAAMLRHKDRPAFAGFWSEESYPMPRPAPGEFETFLEAKYGVAYRSDLGLGSDESIEPSAHQGTWDETHNRRIQVEYLDWGGDKFISGWRETQEFMHGLRKSSSLAFSISAPVHMSTAIGIYPRGGEVIDLHGPQSYSSGGTDMAFLMDLVRDGETRPVFCEFYNWYTPNIDWAERGYAMHLMHGESFFNFYFAQIFEQAPHGYPLWAWNPERWETAERVFERGHTIRRYLGRTGSAANVALIYSDRTDQSIYGGSVGGRPRRYYQHQAAVWQSLQQAHIPIDSIWAETMTPPKLARYKALVLVDAKSLTPEEEAMLRDWVYAGGVLLTGGTTSLFNRWGEREDNYRLTDVFGVDYRGHATVTDPAESDSYVFVDAHQSVVPLVGEGLDPGAIRRFVHREVKPEKSLITFQTVAAEFMPQGIPEGQVFEYDAALGYDIIHPHTAEIVAQWDNGDPAITVNAFGDGICIFRAEIYPGFSHTAWNWEMHALHKDFWPGLQALQAALLRAGLDRTGGTLPLELAGCPERVEAVIRTQPHENRWLLHFLNFDPALDLVDAFQVTLHSPTPETVRLYYADNGETIPVIRDGNALRFDVREFAIHELVVVEY